MPIPRAIVDGAGNRSGPDPANWPRLNASFRGEARRSTRSRRSSPNGLRCQRAAGLSGDRLQPVLSSVSKTLRSADGAQDAAEGPGSRAGLLRLSMASHPIAAGGLAREPPGLIVCERWRTNGSSARTQEYAMALYVGLDVSQKETEICVLDSDGWRTWRGKCPSQPECIAAMLREHAPDVARVGRSAKAICSFVNRLRGMASSRRAARRWRRFAGGWLSRSRPFIAERSSLSGWCAGDLAAEAA
jgi:hypothetical protein